MKLLVSTDVEQEVSFDTVVISPTEFCTSAGHLFILSHDFDVCIVELSDKIQFGYLNKLVGKMTVIPKVIDPINAHTITLLTELFPEKSAELRYASIRNPESVKNIIAELSKSFNWESFY